MKELQGKYRVIMPNTVVCSQSGYKMGPCNLSMLRRIPRIKAALPPFAAFGL